MKNTLLILPPLVGLLVLASAGCVQVSQKVAIAAEGYGKTTFSQVFNEDYLAEQDKKAEEMAGTFGEEPQEKPGPTEEQLAEMRKHAELSFIKAFEAGLYFEDAGDFDITAELDGPQAVYFEDPEALSKFEPVSVDISVTGGCAPGGPVGPTMGGPGGGGDPTSFSYAKFEDGSYSITFAVDATIIGQLDMMAALYRQSGEGGGMMPGGNIKDEIDNMGPSAFAVEIAGVSKIRKLSGLAKSGDAVATFEVDVKKYITDADYMAEVKESLNGGKLTVIFEPVSGDADKARAEAFAAEFAAVKEKCRVLYEELKQKHADE